MKNKLFVNVSDKFEPGAESLGDFVRRAADELLRVAELCDGSHDGDLEGAVSAAQCDLIEVEGEY
jgi:hypothetical protein